MTNRIVDEGARPVVIVRSPVAHLSITRTIAGCPDDECVLAFTPVRGIGQGTKDSTIKWNLVEDITNVALAQHVTDDDFLLLRADNSIARVCNICYSDDNNPISATVEGLKRRANIVSCVKEVLEMKMATQNWKVVGAIYGNERLIQRRTISVGGGEGSKTVLPVPESNTLKILGYQHHVNTTDTILAFLRTDLAFFCNIIGRKHQFFSGQLGVFLLYSIAKKWV